jgi:hypothetical protein
VIDPPGLGVPAGAEDEDDDPEEPPDAPDDDEFDDEEPPHALTNAAIENRQAVIAASLRKRMPSLIPGSPPRAACSRRCLRPNVSTGGQRGADVNTIVNDLVVRLGPHTPVE